MRKLMMILNYGTLILFQHAIARQAVMQAAVR
jgi:hypothetical protein